MGGKEAAREYQSNDFNPFETCEAIRPESYIRAEYSRPLRGEARASGTKNMVSKVVAASLSSEQGKVVIRNIPFVGDLDITLALCRRLGVNYQLYPDRTLELSVGEFNNPDVIHDSHRGNRVAILFAGPALAKLGQANISKPGGCQIGERKIDYHLAGLESFGVEVTDRGDHYSLRLRKSQLQGARFDLPFASVGATENLLITASCAKGVSILSNCALEPEIIELVKILQRSGLKIQMFPPRTIMVEGKKHNICSPIEIIPDRVEIASLAIAALSSRGDVFVRGAQHEPLITFLGVLQEMGAGIEIQGDGIRFFYKGPLEPVEVTTEVYPGFPTDFQQPMAVLMSQAEGISSIHETIFESRFGYLAELNKIVSSGVAMTVAEECPTHQQCRFSGRGYRHLAYIHGPVNFGSGEIEITDMRAGFAAINAAVLSRGVVVRGLRSLYRGYEDPVGKLRSLGASIDLAL